jgi:hypothetical protein
MQQQRGDPALLGRLVEVLDAALRAWDRYLRLRTEE